MSAGVSSATLRFNQAHQPSEGELTRMVLRRQGFRLAPDRCQVAQAVEGRMWAAVVGRVVRRASLADQGSFSANPPFRRYKDQPFRYGGFTQPLASASLVMAIPVGIPSSSRAARAAMVPSCATSVMRLPNSKLQFAGLASFAGCDPLLIVTDGARQRFRRRLKIAKVLLGQQTDLASVVARQHFALFADEHKSFPRHGCFGIEFLGAVGSHAAVVPVHGERRVIPGRAGNSQETTRSSFPSRESRSAEAGPLYRRHAS